MALPPVSSVIEQPVAQISLSLSEIAHKKVKGFALSCFEAIAHWFLTVFSCFYPAYNNFYNGLLEQESQISVNGSPRLSRTHSGNAQDDGEESTATSSRGAESLAPSNATAIPAVVTEVDPAQELEDQALVALFECLKQQKLVFAQCQPILPGDNLAPTRELYARCQPMLPGDNLTPRAAAIRAWMTENPIINPELNTDDRALDMFHYIMLDQFPLPILPREINLFYNLRDLRIKDSQIIKLPDGFNPPELRFLGLNNTPIANLPTGFNPIHLAVLDCHGTQITAVPEGFAPIQLLSQTLGGTPSVAEETAIAPPPVELDLEQAAKDQALIDVFHFGIRDQIPPAERPKQTNTGDLTQDAVTIRTWMGENPSALENVTKLFLKNFGFSVLPPEINLLKNLEVLQIEDPLLTQLPDDFNPPKLRILYLSDTPLTELPSSLKPLQLEELVLVNTKLTALPDDFDLPNLKGINLNNSPIQKLPPNFNPQQLEVFHIEGTKIQEFPPGFAPPKIDFDANMWMDPLAWELWCKQQNAQNSSLN